MPSKVRKGGSDRKDDKKATSNEVERVVPLQAVIFADSYETRFSPFTLTRPRCLLPVANTPVIEFTCQFLSSVGVKQVFVYCGNHADMVEEYLKNSRWMKPSCPWTMTVIRSDSRSVGDAMRDLDQKQLIVGDFICVYGDLVANITKPFAAALAAHRARREKNKKAIMTMLFRKDFRSKKPFLGMPVFLTDDKTDRCLHYDPDVETTGFLGTPGWICRDIEEYTVRRDLIDCAIDICTPEVLAQCTDNFDWQSPRKGFLMGVLKDHDTNQLEIYTHVAMEGYAARVKNPEAYITISKDMINRYTYPYCPDTNWMADQSFKIQNGKVYREDGVILSRSCVFNRKVALGKGTSVGDSSTITNSTVGRRCVIGKGVTMTEAYIWDDVHIGDGTTIETAIIGNGVSIGKNCIIEFGAMLSDGVKITDGMTVGRDRRISLLKRKRDYDQESVVEMPSDPKIVGEGGVGYSMELDTDEEVAADVLISGVQNIVFPEPDRLSWFDSDEEVEVEEDHRRTESFVSAGSEEDAGARHRASDFHHEAVTSVFDALQKKEDPDTMQLELRALTLGSNAEGKQVRRAIAAAYARRIASLVEGGASPKDAVAEVIIPYKLLISANVKEEDEQAEFLLFLQTDLASRPQGDKILLFASNALATNDLIEAEGFEAWWKDPRSSATPELQVVRKDTKQLVDVLVGDDDEEDDEGSDDNDEAGEEESDDDDE